MECRSSMFPISRGDVLRWTASTSTDGANGANRKSLTGLDVEKLRGEGTPCGQEVSLRSWFAKILRLHLFSQAIVGAVQ